VNRSTKFWIAVACKDHWYLPILSWQIFSSKTIIRSDFVIYYSSKVTMGGSELYQKFTAIGEVIDDISYQVDMGNGFKPFRRNISYFNAKHIDVKALVPLLSFIKNKNSWGYVFRYGFLEIDQASFEIIANNMLGFNPLSAG
jgi:hypothetical protein